MRYSENALQSIDKSSHREDEKLAEIAERKRREELERAEEAARLARLVPHGRTPLGKGLSEPARSYEKDPRAKKTWVWRPEDADQPDKKEEKAA